MSRRWQSDATEFTVGMNYAEVRGYQSIIQKPIVEMLGLRDCITFEVPAGKSWSCRMGARSRPGPALPGWPPLIPNAPGRLSSPRLPASPPRRSGGGAVPAVRPNAATGAGHDINAPLDRTVPVEFAHHATPLPRRCSGRGASAYSQT